MKAGWQLSLHVPAKSYMIGLRFGKTKLWEISMQGKNRIFLYVILGFLLVSLACASLQPTPDAPPTPQPTVTTTQTITPTATQTLRPSPTLRPTRTPDLVATQEAEEWNRKIAAYYARGYLTTTSGRLRELDDFSYDWAQLGWYNWLPIGDSASDFFMSAHFKWDSALQNSNTSGCGFIFGLQPNEDHYAIFLDRSKVYFAITDRALGYSKPITPTRGTGLVNFDYPAEADFALIVKGAYAYVLVNGEAVGEYTLSESRSLHGSLGLTVLSGTNREYGTHCEMTDLHLWVPEQ
jgi:hypothetical protein